MADSKLKLEIVTALDNAGLKATKEQIAGIEQELSKVNKNDSFYGLDKSLTGLPGKMGKVVGGLGSIGKAMGTVGLALEAWKVGWELGTWLGNNVINPLLGIKDAEEELIKKNKKLAESNKKTMESFESAGERLEYNSAQAQKSIDNEIKLIERMKQAYLRSAKAKNDFYNIGMDAEIQNLERERFENIYRLESEGDTEGVAQANALYDVYRKQIEAKKQLKEFDRETDSLYTQDELEQDRIQKEVVEKRYAIEKQIAEQQKRLDWLEEKAGMINVHELDRKKEKVARKIKSLEAQKEELYQQERAYDLDETTSKEIENRRLRRAVLLDQLNTGIDYAAKEYDRTVDAYGNPLGLSFGDKDFIEGLSENSKHSTDLLGDILHELRLQTNQDKDIWRMR